MRHRHSGPAVRYRTRRGNTRYRNRPMHKITMKGKERRRGARRFLGFGKSGDEIASDHDEYTEEELDYLRDTYDKEPEEIEESEAEQAIEEFREDKKDERLLDELNERKQPGFGKKDIDVWENYTGD